MFKHVGKRIWLIDLRLVIPIELVINERFHEFVLAPPHNTGTHTQETSWVLYL